MKRIEEKLNFIKFVLSIIDQMGGKPAVLFVITASPEILRFLMEALK